MGSGAADPWLRHAARLEFSVPSLRMGSGAVDPWVCHMERLEYSVLPPYPQGLWCPTQLTTLALVPLILGAVTLRGLSLVPHPINLMGSSASGPWV